MSKKSRRRNRKILGALAAGLGAMALMKGRGTPAANVDSGRGGDSASAAARVAANTAPAVTGTEYPGANKVVAPVKTKPYLSRMEGHGPNAGVTGQNTRANYAQKMRNRVTGVNAPPSILNPYRAPVQPRGRLSSFSKGGRVKGCGIAKRGVGRAMKKGRK
jgi:hypothetical protein